MNEKSQKPSLGAIGSFIAFFFRNTLVLLRQNAKVVTAFVLICSTLSLIGTSTLTSLTTMVLMRAAGVSYIVPANLAQVMLNPVGILVLVVEQVIATLIALFQVGGLLHAFSMSQIGRETNLYSMFVVGARTCARAIRPRNWLIVPFMLVLLPLAKVLPLSSTTYKLVLPGFINQTIEYTPAYRMLYAGAYAALLCLTLVFIFAINIFVLREEGFVRACSQSRQLVRGRYLSTVVALAVLTLVLNVAINTVASAVTVNVSELLALLGSGLGVATRSAQMGTYTHVLRSLLQALLIPAVNNAGLAVLFYRYLDDEELVGSLARSSFSTRRVSPQGRRAIVASLVAVLAAATVYLAQRYSFLIEPVDRPLVCAHRGDNVNAPENTMPAFELAFSEGLPWIELDVHQTADGVIVCSHDASIARVTGHDLKISEHSFEELSRHEMLDDMPGSYEHVTIPTLEEVLTKAKEQGVRVQVELKGSEGDVDFEEHVLAVIDKTGMHDEVMVIGQSAEHMMRVAELDPTITKGYCMFVAQGDLADIPYTDNVSIEETNVTPELVRELHDRGIEVFCWTVDLEDTVQYLVSCDVDVIGTDNPLLISSALDLADYSGGLPRVIYLLLDVIANMSR